MNETIDLDETRLTALRSHVPSAVWLIVLIVATFGCAASGYSAGTTGSRSGFVNVILPILIAVVVTLVVDLDRPRGGLIGIRQDPLIDLKQSFGDRGEDNS